MAICHRNENDMEIHFAINLENNLTFDEIYYLINWDIPVAFGRFRTAFRHCFDMV